MVDSNRKRLDKLQRSQGWAVAMGVVASTMLIVLLGVVPYIFNAPDESREIQGTVTSFETIGGSQIKTFIHVRLDDGGTVRVAINQNVFAKPVVG